MTGRLREVGWLTRGSSAGPASQTTSVGCVLRAARNVIATYEATTESRQRARASIAMLLCSKALAAIRGRDFATPDDVRDIALPVLRHRLALRAEAELDGSSADVVIADIIRTIEVPR